MIERLYLVGDRNGTYLSDVENELTTNVIINAKVFTKIGDAMRACINYNKNRFSFVVMNSMTCSLKKKK